MSFKYSYNTIVYSGEDYVTQVKRLNKFGYDGIELVGEPSWYNFNEVNKLNDEYSIKVNSICSIFTSERDLIHPEISMRTKAIDYCKEIADMGAEISSTTMIVAPSPVGKIASLEVYDEEMKYAVDSIQQVGEYTQKVGINISIEPWNRYETYFINRLEQAEKILDQLDLTNAGIHGDTFHMSIEEENIAEAYRNIGSKLNHCHIADSNRAAPGTGHTDFKPIMQALKDINYDNYITMELIPAVSDPFACVRGGKAEEFKDNYTEQSINLLKKIEKELI